MGWAYTPRGTTTFTTRCFAALTGDRAGHRQDFGSLADVQKALEEGFVNDGRHSGYRRGPHGTSSAGRPGHQLVAFTQNHDQVANSSGGVRLSGLLTFEEQKLAAAVLCCAPCLPLFFMGQEWGETAPFHYFTSHGDPALARAVSEGRARQQEVLGVKGAPADPQAEATFLASKLQWALVNDAPHAQLLCCTRELLALRQSTAALGSAGKEFTRVTVNEQERWLQVLRGGTPSALGLFNFSREAAVVPLPPGRGALLVFSTADARYGGPGTAPSLRGSGVLVPPSSAALYLLEP